MISPILIAMIILICVFLDRVSDRFGIPVLLLFADPERVGGYQCQ